MEVVEYDLVATIDAIALLIARCALVEAEVHVVGQSENGVRAELWFGRTAQEREAFRRAFVDGSESRRRISGACDAVFVEDGFAAANEGETNGRGTTRSNDGACVNKLGAWQMRHEIRDRAQWMRGDVAVVSIAVIDGIGQYGSERSSVEGMARTKHERDMEGTTVRPDERAMLHIPGRADGDRRGNRHLVRIRRAVHR